MVRVCQTEGKAQARAGALLGTLENRWSGQLDAHAGWDSLPCVPFLTPLPLPTTGGDSRAWGRAEGHWPNGENEPWDQG